MTCACPECKHRRNPSLATVIFVGAELLEIEDAHPGYLRQMEADLVALLHVPPDNH